MVLGDLFRGFKERLVSELPTDLYRFVKQVYRERIRRAMLGKCLGTPQNVAAQYAEAHPVQDDAEVLRLAKHAQAKLATDKWQLDAKELDVNPYLKNIVATAGIVNNENRLSCYVFRVAPRARSTALAAIRHLAKQSTTPTVKSGLTNSLLLEQKIKNGKR